MNAEKKNKKRTAVTSGQRMLLGMVVGLAVTLCALEYGRPILEMKPLGELIVDDAPLELPPITFPPKPDPPKEPEVIDLVKPEPRNVFKIVKNDVKLKEADTAVFEEPHDSNLLAMYVEPEPVIEPKIWNIPEVMPEFPGGEKGLFKFLNDKTNYPAAARKNGIRGVVYVQFVVRPDGTVDPENIEILRSVHPWLDEEAIRVIKKMPKWKPGKQSGRPVSVYYKLPFRFILE